MKVQEKMSLINIIHDINEKWKNPNFQWISKKSCDAFKHISL